MMNRRSLLSGVGGALTGAALANFSLPFAAYADDLAVPDFWLISTPRWLR
jgi:hypothetical protein